VPKVEESVKIPEEVKDHTKATQENEEPSVGSTHMKQLLIEIWNLFSNLNIDPARFLNKLPPVAVILKLPWSSFSNVLGFGSAKQPDAFSESQSVCSSIDHHLWLKKSQFLPSPSSPNAGCVLCLVKAASQPSTLTRRHVHFTSRLSVWM
jgi:hypothetical protein